MTAGLSSRNVAERTRHLTVALDFAKQLEAVVRDAKGGWADHRTLAEVERLAWQIEWTLPDAYFRENLSSARNWAGILYSAWKHHRYPGGAAGLHDFVFGDVYVVRAGLERQLRKLQDPWESGHGRKLSA